MANKEQRRNREKKKPKSDKNKKKTVEASPSFLSAAQKSKEQSRPLESKK